MIIDEFCNIILFFLVCFILSIFLIFLTFIVKSNKNFNFEKISPYECGFEEFNDTYSTFDNQFFIIGIIFILFDLETIFLIPFTISLNFINLFGYFFVLFFLIPLIIGFIYEIKLGIFDWSL